MPDAEPPVQVAAHGMRWTCVADFAGTLPRLDVARARQGRSLPTEEFVKQSTVRVVTRAADPDQACGPGLFIKWYTLRGLRERLKHVLVPTKPEVEWRVARALGAAGIPTCRVLAYAVKPTEAFLISRAIPDAEPLTEFLARRLGEGAPPDPQLREELLRELARLTAALVTRGFTHCDYHGDNIIIRPDAPPGARLYVLDLHSVRLRRPTPRSVCLMLAMLNPALCVTATPRRDMEEFLRRFLEAWPGGPGQGEDAYELLAGQVARDAGRLARRRVRSRTRRCLVQSTLFTIERAGGFLIHRRRDFPSEAAIEAVRLHRDAIATGTAADLAALTVLRKGRRTEVTIVPADTVPDCARNQPASAEQLGPGRLCVKAFRRDARLERLKDLMRPRSRARAAWVAHHLFAVTSIPAPRPIALLEAPGKLRGAPDYLITEAVENAGDLFHFIRDHKLSRQERADLGRATAALLVSMADQGVYHPDTKPTNFLVSRHDGRLRLHLVDLDRVRRGGQWGRWRWARCLMRLNTGLPDKVTVLDRMRCLRRCDRSVQSGGGRWSAAERLELARRVRALSAERRAKGPK